MDTAKIFENGRSQAVSLPRGYRFKDDEVFIKRIGDVVMLIPKGSAWDTFMNGINGFSDDFFEDGRVDEPPTERKPV